MQHLPYHYPPSEQLIPLLHTQDPAQVWRKGNLCRESKCPVTPSSSCNSKDQRALFELLCPSCYCYFESKKKLNFNEESNTMVSARGFFVICIYKCVSFSNYIKEINMWKYPHDTRSLSDSAEIPWTTGSRLHCLSLYVLLIKVFFLLHWNFWRLEKSLSGLEKQLMVFLVHHKNT